MMTICNLITIINYRSSRTDGSSLRIGGNSLASINSFSSTATGISSLIIERSFLSILDLLMTLDDSIFPPVTIQRTGGGAPNAVFGVNEGRRFIPTVVEIGVTVGEGGREEGVDLGAEAAGITVGVTAGGRVVDLGVEEVDDLSEEATVGVTE